jgi:hypothetical protein
MELMKSVQKTSESSKPGEGCLVVSQIARRPEDGAGVDMQTDTLLRRGALVRLKGLQRSTDLNGCVGKLLHFKAGSKRWDVDVEDRGVRALRVKNLERLSDDTPHKDFKAWLTSVDVGGDWQLAEVGVMLRLDKLEDVTTTQKKGGQQHASLKCTLSAVGRAHIHHVCNPEAFAEKTTFMVAHVERLNDNGQSDAGQIQREGRVVELLKENLALQRKVASEVSVVPREKVLKSLSAQPGDKFWEVVTFWEMFLQARVRTQKFKNVIDNCLQKISALPPDRLAVVQEKLARVLSQNEEGQPLQIEMKDLPPELLGELRSMRSQPELSIFDRRKIDQALPLQQLIQCDSHRERLRILETALANEKAQLEMETQESQGISLSDALEHGTFELDAKDESKEVQWRRSKL